MNGFRSDKSRRAMFANINKDNKFSYAPVYAAGDISAMGVDVVGTAGSAVVGAVPLVAGLGAMYVGADIVLKSKDRLTDQYKREKAHKPAKKSYMQRLIEKDKTVVKRHKFSHSAGLEYYEWPEYGVQD